MSSTQIPSDPGTLSPREARAWMDSAMPMQNLAANEEMSARAQKFMEETVAEWSERMRNLHNRWRISYWQLRGNTTETTGPNQVHVPEIYKAMETVVPRIEESILEKDPWFEVIPRREEHKEEADTIAAYLDYQFDRAKVRDLVQPAIRNMLVSQCAAFYVQWQVKEEMRTIRSVDRSFDKKGQLKRKVKKERKKVVSYYGPKVELIDPYDFIIDTKATNPQDALYVGHRVWMSVDEIKRVGEQLGWANLDEVEKLDGNSMSLGLEQEYYQWTRDPTSRFGMTNNRFDQVKGRPGKVEVVTIYGKWRNDETGQFKDWRMVMAGGKAVLELRENPYDGGIRPYATARASKNGHEFYGTGPFDNATRLNQHLDKLYQIQLRASEVAACPMVFAEEDTELPDSLYGIRPFTVFKGTGPVRFTQVPDGAVQSIQAAIFSLQRNIEETVGAFRIQMGQDSNGTATEATLSLQEGNRRLRGLIRAMAGGLEQLLEVVYAFDQQFAIEDEQIPVLGKRALSLRRRYLTVGPADLIPEVRFELVGLHSIRTYGMKATGLQAFVNSMAPFIMANPQAVDQPALMHSFAEEMIGPEEADMLVRVPTPAAKLKSQKEENFALLHGTEILIDEDDDHEEHMRELTNSGLVRRAMDPKSDLPTVVRAEILSHYESHRMALNRRRAQDAAMQRRMQPPGGLPPEAGGIQSADGQGSSPQVGGMSDAMRQMSGTPGGQLSGENPGPASPSKYGRTGRAGRTVNQTENA